MKNLYFKLLPFVLIILIVAGIIHVNVIAQVEEDYFFIRSFGGGAEQIRDPVAVALSPDNRIFTINNGRMTVIDQSLRTFSVWEDHYLFNSTDLTFDLLGNVLVTDVSTNQITKFSMDGEILDVWGATGSDPGEFDHPVGVAVNSNCHIFVADQQNQRIQVFSEEGIFIRQWTGQTFASGEFIPYSIVVDKNNYSYVVEISNNSIQKFDQNGNYISSFGSGELENPRGIAINEENQIFVVDNYSHSIKVFNIYGEYLTTIGSEGEPGDGHGQFQWPMDVALDSYQNLYISDSGNHRIQKLSKNGTFLNMWGAQISAPGEFNLPSGIDFGLDGTLIVADADNDRIQRFSQDGTFLNEWGGSYLSRPFDIAVDAEGNIFVDNMGFSRIVKFSPEGDYITSWGGENILRVPYGLAINPINGDIYVADTGNNMIKVFDPDGNLKFGWGEYGSGNGQFFNPYKITFDSIGCVYVTDRTRVQKFDDIGNFILKWGEEEYTFGYMEPYDIEINETDRVFVLDSKNHMVHEFNTSGELIKSWGSYGRLPGQFIRPMGIIFDSHDTIYVADGENNRIQVFDTDIPEADTETGLIQNGDFMDSLYDWTKGGDLQISPVFDVTESDYKMLLSEPVPQTEQGQATAWAYSSFFVDPTWDRPVLSFKYNMFVNDIMDYSDFFVAIQDGVGLNHLATVLRDGYQPCIPNVAPAAGTDLGWRSVTYDLSKYKGQHIRLVFSNRNLWPNSWGIWTYVDDVRVLDAGPLPPLDGPYFTYLPMMNDYQCDPVSDRGRNVGGELMIRPETP